MGDVMVVVYDIELQSIFNTGDETTQNSAVVVEQCIHKFILFLTRDKVCM